MLKNNIISDNISGFPIKLHNILIKIIGYCCAAVEYVTREGSVLRWSYFAGGYNPRESCSGDQ